jgi:hypothetical protein
MRLEALVLASLIGTAAEDVGNGSSYAFSPILAGVDT